MFSGKNAIGMEKWQQRTAVGNLNAATSATLRGKEMKWGSRFLEVNSDQDGFFDSVTHFQNSVLKKPSSHGEDVNSSLV